MSTLDYPKTMEQIHEHFHRTTFTTLREVYLPVRLAERLEALAKAQPYDRSAVIGHLLQLGLEQFEHQGQMKAAADRYRQQTEGQAS